MFPKNYQHKGEGSISRTPVVKGTWILHTVHHDHGIRKLGRHSTTSCFQKKIVCLVLSTDNPYQTKLHKVSASVLFSMLSSKTMKANFTSSQNVLEIDIQ